MKQLLSSTNSRFTTQTFKSSPNSCCTCTAELLGSFNHVAGVLFRIEAAVLIGETHPTCTSILASRNILNKKKKVILVSNPRVS